MTSAFEESANTEAVTVGKGFIFDGFLQLQ